VSQLLVEITLVIIILALLVWIFYIGGWDISRRDLVGRIHELEDKVQDLNETNETLRASIDSTVDRTSRPLERILKVAEDLILVRDAGLGSNSAEGEIKEKYSAEPSPKVVRDIFSSIDTINPPMKRRLAHEIFVGDIGRVILRCLDNGESLSEASSEAGVPLRTIKQRVRLLKTTGYLDRQMNLTDWGTEVVGF